MEGLNAQIDLFLTEISIELLGNKMYDINGKRQDKIINLFKALPEVVRNANTNENSNDFLCSLGYQSDFTEDENSVKAFLNDQLNFVLEDANTSSEVNNQIISCLRNYKSNQKLLAAEVSSLNTHKLVENCKLTNELNSLRLKALDGKKSNVERVKAITAYYEREKDELLKINMDTIRLIKYIINDRSNEEKKGDLIGYVHAMRSVKDNKNQQLQRGSKPYRLPKERKNN